MKEEVFMRRAIELARQGEGWTSPNPMVGAVIVREGRIIGEGYHKKCGELHAERNALANLTESAKGATMYVTLEPCCHYGKTPPCTEAILKHGLAKVVIGSRDPNPKVSGRGAAILQAHGVKVVQDFLKEECDELNPVFFHYITHHTPYVVMKYAMTLDGKIATTTGASKWITGEAARGHVQKLRNHYRGILVGIGTVLADDPLLNCRMEGGRSPVRIICDSRLQIPLESQIVKTASQYQTIVATAAVETDEKFRLLQQAGIIMLRVPDQKGYLDLKLLMSELGKREIDSVLVEGGGTINDSVLKAGIVKYLYVYVAPKIFGGVGAKSPVEGNGVLLPADAYQLLFKKQQQLADDILLEYECR